MGMLTTTSSVDGGVAPAAAERSVPRWVTALQLLGVGVWLALVTWRLDLAPGMAMDEGWSIISARGQWPPANPLSGMSAYTGALPVLLLRLLGTSHGLLVLRGASVVMHGSMLVCIAAMLRRLYPRHALACWAMPLIATSPTWLLSIRSGMEVTMFTSPFAIIGFYLMTLGNAGLAFAGGALWGLMVYNHLLGLWAVAAISMAWLAVDRRWQPRVWWPIAVGFCVGIAPRVAAMALYDNAQITDTAAAMSLKDGLADLLVLPGAFWDFLHGRPAFLRYMGRLAQPILPYWWIGLLLFVPWVWRPRQLPRAAGFVLLAVVLLCLLTTLGAPYFEMRYFVLPTVGLPLGLVLLGAGAIERDRRWGYLVRAASALLVAGNLYYLLADFYLPWRRRELGMTAQYIGKRSPPVGSWHFLPKEEVVRYLSQLSPAPQQIVSPASINRPLRALMDGQGFRIVTADEADNALPSVYVDYRSNTRARQRYCLRARKGNLCFTNPATVDTFFVVYQRSGR